MIIRVDSILCNCCFECHNILPFLCAPESGLEGLPGMAKGENGFYINPMWARKYAARFHSAMRSCKAGALRIDEE